MIRLLLSGADESTGREGARRLRGATIATDLGASAATPEGWDAAVFVGPAPPGEEVVGRFLAAGKHVLLTAEAWLSSDVLGRLSAARPGGGQLAVVSPDHHLPSRRLLRQQLDAGRLGEPGLVRIHRWRPAAPDDGAGPLARDFELVAWLMGRAPNLVYAAGEEAGGFVQAHLGFPGGGMALIDYSDRLPPGDGYHSVSVIAAAGAAYADDHHNVQLVFQGGHPRAVRTDEGARQLADMVQEFVDALRAGRDVSAGVAAWRSACAVAEAVRQSLQSRQAIPLEGH